MLGAERWVYPQSLAPASKEGDNTRKEATLMPLPLYA